MTRLENHNKKVARRRMVTTVILIAAVVLFFFNSGIALLIDGSMAVARFLGWNRAQEEQQAAPEFAVVELDEVPTATNSAAVMVTGRAQNTSSVYPYLNGVRLDEIDVEESGEFTVEIAPLESGDNELYVAGETAGGNDKKKSDTYTITFSAEKPTIVISEPSDGLKTPRNEITVAGSVTGGSGSLLRVNGMTTVIGQGGTFRTFVKLNEGDNTVTVTVTDAAGNTEEKSVKVTYEK